MESLGCFLKKLYICQVISIYGKLVEYIEEYTVER